MQSSNECNFAGRLLKRLAGNSSLADAATGQTFSASEITRQIIRFSSGFLSIGLRAGDRVLISCGSTPSSAFAYLGAMYAGCVPVLLDERKLAASGELVFAKANAKAAWTSGRVRWDWATKNGFPQVQVDDKFNSRSMNPSLVESLPPTPCSENDLAVLMPTSGSTGVPRLVMVTHGNLIANTEAIIRSQDLGWNDKAMLIMPVSYVFGASVLHTHLYQGGGVVFDSRFMFPDKVLQAIDTYGCTTFAGVPTVYNILLRRSHIGSIAMTSLRRFLVAGGALAPESIEKLRAIVPSADVFVMYGQTEATARVSCLPPDRLRDKLGSAGLPLDNVKVRIDDETGKEVSKGDVGEIQVRGPSVCAGYLDDPEATRRKFDHGWLKTGDIGSLDDEGFIWIKGRTSEFIKIRGLRVSFAEVEAAVAAVPGVYECAAAGVEHPEAGEALAVFVVEDSIERDSAHARANGGRSLIEKVRHALPSQWTCTVVKVVPELPRTANGKIARSQLQTLA